MDWIGVKNHETGIISKKGMCVQCTNSHPAHKYRKIGLRASEITTYSLLRNNLPSVWLPFKKWEKRSSSGRRSSWGTATEDPRNSVSFTFHCLPLFQRCFLTIKLESLWQQTQTEDKFFQEEIFREALASRTHRSVLFWYCFAKGRVRKTSVGTVPYYHIILLFTILSRTAHQKTNCGEIIKTYPKQFEDILGKTFSLYKSCRLKWLDQYVSPKNFINDIETHSILTCTTFRSIWSHCHKSGGNLPYGFFRYSMYKTYHNFFFNNICLRWSKCVLPISLGLKHFPLESLFVWER